MQKTRYNLDEARTVAEIVIKLNGYCSEYTVDKLVDYMLLMANENYPENSNRYGYVATMGFVVTVCKEFGTSENRYIKFSVDSFIIQDYIKQINAQSIMDT